MIHGFLDVAGFAEILDIRASTLRNLVSEGSDMVPPPIKLGTEDCWPMAAIRAWAKAGWPRGWNYDSEEFSLLAWQEFAEANRLQVGGDRLYIELQQI